MEVLKEYSSSIYFNNYSYVVIISQIPAFLIFLGLALESREGPTIVCPSSLDFCLVKYREQINSFPFYGFVLLNFLSQLAVCIVYSLCFVKSRVDELKLFLTLDPENPRRRPKVKTRRVFYSYCLHLLLRFVLGILFIVLQNYVIYTTKFVCVLPTVKPTAVNSTNVKRDDADSAVDCFIGTDYAMGIWIVNVLFALLVFAELLYLSARARQSKEFTFDSEFCQIYLFNKSVSSVTLHETALRMKRRVLEDTEILEPLIAEPWIEKDRLLDDIFVDLVICTGRAEHEFADFSKRHEIFDIYLKPQEKSISIKKLEELFLPNRDTQDPRKVLVIGRPGIGKSLLCTKLLRDWSKGELLCDGNKSFEHLFLFQFRHFNTEMKNISLQQLLSLLYPEGRIDSEIFQYMLDNPEKILLIFDGLDEFEHHRRWLEDEQASVGNSPTEEMPFSALYGKLLKGKQLCGATVLTTCKPNVVQSVSGLTFDRTVEIMGFTPEKVQEYVSKFCAHDVKIVNKLWEHISSNSELLSFCYVPVNSFIVCSFLEVSIKLQDQDSGSSLPTTSTEIFNGALRLFIFKCHPEFKGRLLTRDYLMENVGLPHSLERTLDKAGSLAKTGIEESRLVFDSTEVQGMENCGLFNRMPDRRVSPFSWKSYFCFIHLTLQELLAAREISKMLPSDLSKFIISNISDPKWHLVIQFVAGLLRGQEHEALDTVVNLLCDSLTKEPLLKNEEKRKILLMVKCLFENKKSFAASGLQKNKHLDLSDCQVTPADCPAVVYFIKGLHELTELNLGSNYITDQGVSHLCDALLDVNCKLTKLNLSGNIITDQGISHLCGALKNENCKLTELNLSGSSIADQGISHLCGALKDENCKLAELNLSGNIITDQGVSHLCDALKDVHCKLTELDLSGNNITDQGVSHLCAALKDVHCKLTELDLSGINITDQGVSHLCDALIDAHCKLTGLDLSHNSNITDKAKKQLLEVYGRALINPF